VNRGTHRFVAFAAGVRDHVKTLARAALVALAVLGVSGSAAAHGGGLTVYEVKWLDDTPYLWSSYGLFIGDGERRWNLLCDDVLAADRTPEMDAHPIPVLLPTGAIVAGSQLGFRVYDSSCPVNHKAGVWGDSLILNVAAVDPEGQVLAAIIQEPLAGSYRIEFSTDFGETSQSAAPLPDDFLPERLVIMGEPRPRIYVVGRDEQVRLALVVSEDEGESWETLLPDVPDELARVSLIAVDAPTPGQLLLSRADSATGTTLWSWDEEGGPGELLLALPDLQGVAGFTFGAEPSTLYVAARAQVGSSVVSGSLYVSTDSGARFSVVSPSGPRYSCLAFHAGALYACSDQTDAAFAPFALGRSSDGGLTWDTVMSFTDDVLAPACEGQQCQLAIDDLCVKSGRCEPPVEVPPTAGTAGMASPAASPKRSDSGCSIARGNANVAGFGFLVTCLAGALSWRRMRRLHPSAHCAR
jgi:hypothetical protein